MNDIIRSAIAQERLVLREVDADFVAETQAAGLRQRREGLAFRLSWPRFGLRPRKRVAPRWRTVALRRMIIYVMRHQISAWSHRVFRLARYLHWPRLYIVWARTALILYHGIAYSRGMIGKIADRLGVGAAEHHD